MPPLQKKSPQFYERKLAEIRAEARPTLEKVEAGDFDWRDVAILVELLQRFGDVMDEMIDDPPAIIPDYLQAERIMELWTQ